MILLLIETQISATIHCPPNMLISSPLNCSLFYLPRVCVHLMLRLKTSKFCLSFYSHIQTAAMSYHFQKCLLLFSMPTTLVYFFITSPPDIIIPIVTCLSALWSLFYIACLTAGQIML